MQIRKLLKIFILVSISLFFITKVNAAWYNIFSGADANNQQVDITDLKQENLNKLLDVMDIDSQIKEQVDLILKLADQPLIKFMQSIKKDFPQGEQASEIIHGNYEQYKQKVMTSVDYRKIYYDIYDQKYDNYEILELIKMFQTKIGQKFIKTNLEINKQILLETQPKIIESLFLELPEMNKNIISEMIDSDYLDKIIDNFKLEFKQELRKILDQ